MKFNWAKASQKKKFACHLLMKLMIRAAKKDDSNSEGIEKLWPIDVRKAKDVEVALTINGIEVPFIEIIEELGEIRKSEINQKATELVKIKLDDLDVVFEDIKDILLEYLQDRLGLTNGEIFIDD